MSLAISMFFIFSGSVLLSVLFKKTVEDAIPMTIMSIILILYAFYCFDLLIWGFYLVIALAILGYLSVVYLIKKVGIQQSWQQLKTCLITPGLLVFLLVCAAIYIFTSGNLVSLWDELRLWGAYPKALYYTDALQLGESAILYDVMQSYPPGMPLFVYFIEKCHQSFHESHIFFAYGLFGCSLFLPALKKLQRKDGWAIPLLAFSIFTLPLLFYSSYHDYGDYYKSLFIDPVLGLVIAYDIFLLTTDSFSCWFKTTRLLLALSVTILIKDSGLMFAVLAFIGAIVLEVAIFGRQRRGAKWTTAAARIGLTGMAMAAVCVSWKLLLALFSVHNHLEFSVSLNIRFIKKFIAHLFNQNVITSNFLSNPRLLSFAGLLTLLVFIQVFLLLLQKKGKRPILVISSICLNIGNVLFLCGLYCLCSGPFGESFPSFPRYVNTILLADMGFLFMVFTANIIGHLQQILSSRYLKAAGALLLVIAIIIFPLRRPSTFDGGWNAAAEDHTNTLLSYIPTANQQDQQQNVFIVFDKDVKLHAGLHHRIYFNLIGSHIRIQNFYKDVNITVDQQAPPESVEQALQQFKSRLRQGQYHYVYVAIDNPLIQTQFHGLFGDEVKAKTLYKVQIVNQDVELVRV